MLVKGYMYSILIKIYSSDMSLLYVWYEYMTTQYFERFFFIHLKPRVESLWGVLS
jgi:hypothetical protein